MMMQTNEEVPNTFADQKKDRQGSASDPKQHMQIGCYDVLCGRSKTAFNNVGNRRFRVTVSLALGRYLQAPSRKDRSIVIASVVALIRSAGGRFLQRKHNAWVELSEKEAHEKTAHALRDAASAASKGKVMAPTNNNNNKSSTTNIVEQAKSLSFTKTRVDPPRDDNNSTEHVGLIQEQQSPSVVFTSKPSEDDAIVSSPQSPPMDIVDMISPEELKDLEQILAGDNHREEDDDDDQMLAWLSGESTTIIQHQI